MLKRSAFVLLFVSMSHALLGHAIKIHDTIKKYADYGHIDTKALEILISSKLPLVILDARTGAWDKGNRIGSAQILSSDASEKEAQSLIPNKTSLIVVYCSNKKCPAGSYLATRLLQLGYLNVLKYDDGIEVWMESGLPIRKI